MPMKLNKLSLKDNSIETLLDTNDFIFSIAFCKETNGIFYSNFSRNNISMFDLNKKNVVLYKEEDILSPKSVCLSNNHDRVFYEDDNNGISGFYIKSTLVFSWAGHYAKLSMDSQQNFRNTTSNDLADTKVKTNCITYADDLNIIFMSKCKKNSIDFIDSSGKNYKFIGSGKQDFSSSTEISNVSFNCPTSLCFTNNNLFVADTNNHVIRCFSGSNKWKELPIVGIPNKEGKQDGNCNKSTFRFPTEICNFDKNMFIIDDGVKIRKIDVDKNEVKTMHSTKGLIKSITCDSENVYWTEIIL